MAILNIFKRKPKKEKAESSQKERELKTEVKPDMTKKKRAGQAWEVLKSPQITEKATDLAKQNQYAFKIMPKANKTKVKKAVEDLYGVDVLGVKIIKAHKKKRRQGRILGWRKGYKKAIVKIKEGQKIELLPR